MSKKITLWILVTVLVGGALIAQERAGAPARGSRRRTDRAGAGMRPGQDMAAPMRGGMPNIIADLEEAYKANDREKMGKLIEEMKQRTQERIPKTRIIAPR